VALIKQMCFLQTLKACIIINQPHKLQMQPRSKKYQSTARQTLGLFMNPALTMIESHSANCSIPLKQTIYTENQKPWQNLNKFNDSRWNAGFAEASQIFNDVLSLQADRHGCIQRVWCKLVFVNVFRTAHWLYITIHKYTFRRSLCNISFYISLSHALLKHILILMAASQ